MAGAQGFIDLADASAEFGGIMLLYLKHATDARIAHGKTTTDDLLDAIREGAGLFPILWGTGTGSEVMQRIAAPMVGGMITARRCCRCFWCQRRTC